MELGRIVAHGPHRSLSTIALTELARAAIRGVMPAVTNWLRHAESAKVINAARQHASPAAQLDALVRDNVVAQLTHLKTHPSVALALEQGRQNLHGWVYDTESGAIAALDGGPRRFVSLTEYPHTCALVSQPCTAA